MITWDLLTINQSTGHNYWQQSYYTWNKVISRDCMISMTSNNSKVGWYTHEAVDIGRYQSSYTYSLDVKLCYNEYHGWPINQAYSLVQVLLV